MTRSVKAAVSAPEPLVGPAEVSAFLGGIPEQTLAKWRSAGTGPEWHKVGKHARYRLSEVSAWLDERKRTHARQT